MQGLMKAFVVSGLVCFAVSVSAEDNIEANAMLPDAEKPLSFVLTGGLTYGGDELAELRFTDGDSQKIKAGALLYVGTGFLARFSDSPMSLQATINYHFDISTAENGDATFSRVPLEVIGFYTKDKFRFGAGLSYHLKPTLDIDTDRGSINNKFDDALGYVLQVDYLAAKNLALGARILAIEYEASDVDFSADGNSVGLIGTLMF
ncbi:MAG: hypothetical protein H7A01_12250 [Hahellaceae bacterium]|nr:hypothetical protein [Hahellaceae bacterium]MCP5209909.1 hypothetical protein [Hahellaceae bacterium]